MTPDHRSTALASGIVAAAFGVAAFAVDRAGCPVQGYAGITLGVAAFGFAVRAAYRHDLRQQVSAGQATADLPDSLREIAEYVDAAAAHVLTEGHSAGVEAAGEALDRVTDATTDMVERATERRVLELAFERSAAGQGGAR